MRSSEESKIFRSIADHMKERISIIETTKNYIDGFENWFQVEVMYALIKNGFNASIKGKIKKFKADIVLDNKTGIELRCYKNNFSGNMIKSAIKDHPDAHYFLFLAEDIPRVQKYLKIEEDRFHPTITKITKNWLLILGSNPACTL